MTDYRDTIGKKKGEQEPQTAFGLGDIQDAAGDAVDSATDAASSAADSATDLGGDAISSGDEALSSVGDASSDALDDVADTASGAVGDIGGAVDDVTDNASDTVDDAVDGITDASDSIGDIGDSIGDVGGNISETIDGATDQLGDIGGDISGVGGDALDSVDNISDSVGDIGGDVFDSAQEFSQDSLDSVTDLGDSAIDTGTDLLGGAGDSLTDLGGSVVGVGEDAFGSISDLGGDTLDLGGDLAGGAWDMGGDAVGFGGDLIDGTLDGASSIGEDVTETATGADEEEPQGPTWGEPETEEQRGRCVIQVQESDQGDSRYMTITQSEDGEEVLIGSNGSQVPISTIQSDSDIPFHDTLEDARGACDAADMSEVWEEPYQDEEHNGGVILAQDSNLNETRYFAMVAGDNTQMAAVATDGSTTDVTEDTGFSELPQYPSVESARDALNQQGDPTRSWSDIEQVSQVGQCVIMGQESSDGNTRFFTFTEGDNGEVVAVSNEGDGVVVSSVGNAQNLPHYPTAEDAAAACPSSEGQPEQGGDKTVTDDSTSGDGPESDGPQPETSQVSQGGEGGAPSEEEIDQTADGVDWSSGDPQQNNGGGAPSTGTGPIIEGIPTPALAVGGLGVLGAGAMMLMGGDDSDS